MADEKTLDELMDRIGELQSRDDNDKFTTNALRDLIRQLKEMEQELETLSNEEIVAWKDFDGLLTTIKEKHQVNSEEGK